MPGLIGVTELTAEDFDSCALLVSATVMCWGYNGYGELGNGTRHDFGRARPVSNLSRRHRDRHEDRFRRRRARWWSTGPCSAGATTATASSVTATPGTTSSLPVRSSGLGGVTAITLGDFHACALLADGTVRCWGYNAYGQLGNGDTTDSMRAGGR